MHRPLAPVLEPRPVGLDRAFELLDHEAPGQPLRHDIGVLWRRRPVAPSETPQIDAREVGEGLDAKRVESLTNPVGGVVNEVSLSVHAIGAGLAQMNGLQTKHGIGQVGRLLRR